MARNPGPWAARIARAGAEILASERGAVSVITVAAIVLLSGVFALSVDAGSLYLAQKRLQKAVDLAALKAVTDPSNANTLAQSAVESNFSADMLSQPVSVTQGRYPPTGYTPADLASLAVNSRFEAGAAQPNALQISARGRAPLFLSRVFFSGETAIDAQATAYNEPLVQLTVGTGALTVDSTQSSANDALLSGLLGTSVTLSVASYQGLVDANVRLFGVLDALANITGTPSGDYSALLSASVTYAEVVDALSAAVGADPDLAAVASALQATLTTLRGQVSGAGSLALGDILKLDAEGAANAVGARLNLYAFLRAAAEAANNDNGTTYPVNLSIAGGTVIMRAAVTEPTQVSIVGGEGISVRTSQMRLYMEINPTAMLSVLGNAIAVRFPILFQLASGQATVTSLTCNGPVAANAQVGVTAQAGPVSAESSDIDTTAMHQSAPLPTQPAEIAYAAGIVRVTGSGTVSVSGNPQSLTFNGPFDSSDTQRVSLSAPFEDVTATLAATDDYTVTVLGLPFPTSTVTDQLTTILDAIAPTADTLFGDLLEAMGASTGYMDVTVPYVRCSNPVLAQ